MEEEIDELEECADCGESTAGEGVHRCKPDGYHDCDCCGETIVGEFLCASCVKAGCEANGDGNYDDCQIPRCENCDTQASFFSNVDGKGDVWQSNCDVDECAEEAQSKGPGDSHLQREWKA